MSGKESANYHHFSAPEPTVITPETSSHFLTNHEFPLSSYSTERPGIPLPETYEFLSTQDPQVSEILTPVFDDKFFQQNLVKLQRRLHNSELSDNSRSGLENALAGFMFEEAAHHYLSKAIQGNSVLLTPQETKRLTDIDGLQGNIKEKIRTVPDGLVLQPVRDKTFIVGSCEYTIRANLGDMEMPYKLMNRDKRKQLKQHTSGKVVYDLFTRQTPDIQKKVADSINNMHPELPPRLAYDASKFKAILVTTTENDTPFTHEKCELVRVPISANDIWYLSMSIVSELQNSPSYFESNYQTKRNEYYPTAAD